MKEYVFDLETLGTVPGAVVVSIGAVEIDRSAGSILRTFYERISLADSLRLGLTVDGDTLNWWASRRVDERARHDALTASPRSDVLDVVRRFAEWLGDPKEVIIYGNGPSFDCGIWAGVCRAAGESVPWHFRNERCMRTEKAFHERRGVPWIRIDNELPHHALADAITEAREMLATEAAMDAEIRSMMTHE